MPTWRLEELVSVEFIEIKDKTYIPFAPKAREIIEKVKEARADIPCPYSGTSNCWGKKDYYNHSIPSSKKRIMYDLIDEYCREEEPDFIKDGTRWIPE